MDIETIKSEYNEALERMSAIGVELDEADTETFDEVNLRFVEAEAEVRTLSERIESLEKVATARAAHKPSALAEVPARVVVNEQPTYTRNGEQSFFKDLILARDDGRARERLERNNVEHAEKRAINTTSTSGGDFVIPLYLNDLYAKVLRAGRPFADQCQNLGAPGSMSVNIPAITTGATTAVQTDNNTVSNTDEVTSTLTAATQTIAGQSKASYQLAEFSTPGLDQLIFQDLMGSYNQQVDSKLLNSTVTNAKGLLQVSGVNAITYTQATPTSSNMWGPVFQAKSQIEKTAFVGASFLVMHPSTWNFFLSGLDSNNRPLALSTTGSAFNQMSVYDDQVPQGLAGNIGGIPVLVDANIPVNTGAGTNQGTIALVAQDNLLLWEGTPTFKIADQVGISSLQYVYVLYNYVAWMLSRYPAMISLITGTGLVVQSNF